MDAGISSSGASTLHVRTMGFGGSQQYTPEYPQSPPRGDFSALPT